MSRLIQSISLAAAAAVFAISLPSQAADPTTADCLAANDNSIARRNEHKLLAARAQLLICAAETCPVDIRKECTRRVGEVNASIPTIVFEARDASGKDLSAVKVSMDGQLLAERLEGTALSIDPGEHTFTFETAGQSKVEKQLLIREGEKERHERVVFGEAEKPATIAPQKTSVISQPPPPRGLGTQKIAALAVGGVGLVGVGVGAVFGFVSLSKHNDAEKACPGACTDQRGVDLWQNARSAGNVSTVAFIIGGVALAAGATLWFTAGPTTNTQVGLGPSSIRLKGSW